jgi:uncharacterized membrane-anchored protein YhcB (DUF1043 family)
MNKIEMYLAAIGTVIGIGVGVMITEIFRDDCTSCPQLEQENQILRDMLFDQQDPYRPDTTQEPKEVEGCEL